MSNLVSYTGLMAWDKTPWAPPLVELAGGKAGHLLAWERHERDGSWWAIRIHEAGGRRDHNVVLVRANSLRPLEPPEVYKVVPRRVLGLDGQIRGYELTTLAGGLGVSWPDFGLAMTPTPTSAGHESVCISLRIRRLRDQISRLVGAARDLADAGQAVARLKGGDATPRVAVSIAGRPIHSGVPHACSAHEGHPKHQSHVRLLEKTGSPQTTHVGRYRTDGNLPQRQQRCHRINFVVRIKAET